MLAGVTYRALVADADQHSSAPAISWNACDIGGCALPSGTGSASICNSSEILGSATAADSYLLNRSTPRRRVALQLPDFAEKIRMAMEGS
jgi:hypothetical protein